MFNIVVTVLTMVGKLDVAINERFDTYAEAMDFGQQLMSTTLPEMGSVVDWSIKLFVYHNDSKDLLNTWTMDDEQPYYEHRILNRDNMDAAHYQAHLRFVAKYEK